MIANKLLHNSMLSERMKDMDRKAIAETIQSVTRKSTIIRVDLDILNEQILECDTKADNASSEHERELFDGAARLLSHIAYAVECGEDIKLIGAKDVV